MFLCVLSGPFFGRLSIFYISDTSNMYFSSVYCYCLENISCLSYKSLYAMLES